MLKQLELHLEALIDGKWHHVSYTRITDYHLFAFLNGEDIEHLRNNEDIEPVCPKSITLNLDETSDTKPLPAMPASCSKKTWTGFTDACSHGDKTTSARNSWNENFSTTCCPC